MLIEDYYNHNFCNDLNEFINLNNKKFNLKEGISKENSKKINVFIKNLKLKVQSQIQGEQVRVTAKKIDDLQLIIEKLKKHNFEIHLDFVNFKK